MPVGVGGRARKGPALLVTYEHVPCPFPTSLCPKGLAPGTLWPRLFPAGCANGGHWQSARGGKRKGWAMSSPCPAYFGATFLALTPASSRAPSPPHCLSSHRASVAVPRWLPIPCSPPHPAHASAQHPFVKVSSVQPPGRNSFSFGNPIHPEKS